MRARTKLLIPSVIAVLLSALIPAITQAETSSEIIYCCESGKSSVPEIEPSHPGKGHRQKSQEIHAGEETPGETDEPEVEEAARPNTVLPDRGKGPPSGDGGNHKPRTATKPSISDNEPVSFSPLPAKSGPDQLNQPGDDGSSPVIPILIAVAVLAALSIGVALRRGRSAV